MNITTQEDRMKVKEYLKQACAASARKADEQAHINDIIKTLHEQHDIEPKVARSVMSAMMKGTAPEIKAQNDDFAELCEMVA